MEEVRLEMLVHHESRFENEPTASNINRESKRPRIPSEISTTNQSDPLLKDLFDETHPVDNQDGNKQEKEAMTADTAQFDDDDPDVDDEPNWDDISRFELTRSDVELFLAAREKRSDANTRFAAALDGLHDAVSHSIEELVSSVADLYEARSKKLNDYEKCLNFNYAINEKKRASMQEKLEKSARIAQGLFAELLMRISKQCTSLSEAAPIFDGSDSLIKDQNNIESKEIDEIDMGTETPDWGTIILHEPAKSEVPMFLEAKNRREAACSRFASSIEEFQISTEAYLKELTQAIADMYNSRSLKLDEYEHALKLEFITNHELRIKMQTTLQQTAAVARELFDLLIDRVNPNVGLKGMQSHKIKTQGNS